MLFEICHTEPQTPGMEMMWRTCNLLTPDDLMSLSRRTSPSAPLPGCRNPLASFGLAHMQPAYSTNTDLVWLDLRHKQPNHDRGQVPNMVIRAARVAAREGCRRSTCNKLTPGFLTSREDISVSQEVYVR